MVVHLDCIIFHFIRMKKRNHNFWTQFWNLGYSAILVLEHMRIKFFHLQFMTIPRTSNMWPPKNWDFPFKIPIEILFAQPFFSYIDFLPAICDNPTYVGYVTSKNSDFPFEIPIEILFDQLFFSYIRFNIYVI